MRYLPHGHPAARSGGLTSVGGHTVSKVKQFRPDQKSTREYKRALEHASTRRSCKSSRTVGAKGRVFPEALTQVSFSWGGGPPGKIHDTFIKLCNLQHFGAQTASPNFWCYNFAAKIVTNKMWNLGTV